MKEYVVFDGRYKFDPDRASVMEVMGEYTQDSDAIIDFGQDYEDMDAVLVSFDEIEGNLVNPTILASIY